jgi:competence protein ComEC
LSAQIGTLPFTLIYFSKLSLIALAANLIVIPLTGIILGVSIFTILLNFISPWLAGCYAAANNLFTYFLFLFVNSASSFEFSFLWVRNFSIQYAILFYLFFILLIYFFRKFNSIAAKTVLVIIVFFNIFIYAGLDDKNLFSKDELNILMIDVGG